MLPPSLEPRAIWEIEIETAGARSFPRLPPNVWPFPFPLILVDPDRFPLYIPGFHAMAISSSLICIYYPLSFVYTM